MMLFISIHSHILFNSNHISYLYFSLLFHFSSRGTGTAWSIRRGRGSPRTADPPVFFVFWWSFLFKHYYIILYYFNFMPFWCLFCLFQTIIFSCFLLMHFLVFFSHFIQLLLFANLPGSPKRPNGVGIRERSVSAVYAMLVSVKKDAFGEEYPLEDGLLEHRDRGRRAVFAAGLQSKGWHKRSAFSQTPILESISFLFPSITPVTGEGGAGGIRVTCGGQ